MWVSGQRRAPVALPAGKTRCPLYRRQSGPPGQVWTGAENLWKVRESNLSVWGWEEGEIFLTRPDRLLWPTQPPVQWAPGIYRG
jgi:hypothetical protein